MFLYITTMLIIFINILIIKILATEHRKNKNRTVFSKDFFPTFVGYNGPDGGIGRHTTLRG